MLVGLGSGNPRDRRRHDRDRRCRRRHAADGTDRGGHRAGASGGRIARLMRRAQGAAEAQTECRALDGTRIEVFANLGNVADAAAAVANGAEGCGLLRTEFLFIDRDTAPDEDEQLAAYQGIADGARDATADSAIDGRGRRQAAALPAAAARRRIRRSACAACAPRSRIRDLLRTQLRAALRVQPAGSVRLLIPMVTDVAEILAVRSVIDELTAELGTAGSHRTGRDDRDSRRRAHGVRPHPRGRFPVDRQQRPDAVHSGDGSRPSAACGPHRCLASGGAQTHRGGRRVPASPPASWSPSAAAWRRIAGGADFAGSRRARAVGGARGGTRHQAPDPALRISDCRELALRCLDLASAAEVRALVAQTIGPIGRVHDETALRRITATGPRIDAADRGAADRRSAVAPGTTGSARTGRRWRRPAMRFSRISACCLRSASVSAWRARITARPASPPWSAIW